MIAAGDLNGDGKIDLVTADGGTSAVSVLLGNGAGGFSVAAYTVADAPVDVAIGDLEGDGDPDLLVATPNVTTTTLLLNAGNGTFGSSTDIPNSLAGLTNASRIAVADFDGDFHNDPAYVSPAGVVGVITGVSPHGPIGSPVDVGGAASKMIPADVNHDGLADLVVAVPGSNAIAVLISSGTSFTMASYTTGASPQSVAAGDFDGDGDLDLVVASPSAGASVLLNNGAGAFPTHTEIAAGAGASGVAVGDFDGDLHLDIAISNATASPFSLSILAGHGDGTFAAATSVTADAARAPRSIAAADFNGDGRPDLATAANDGASSASADIYIDTSTISACPTGDPYADAVGAGTSALVLNAGHAVGAPDGSFATVVSVLGTSLVLDMGAGEEGTGDLQVTYGGLSISVVGSVDFLRADGSVIGSGSLHMSLVSAGSHNAVVTYTHAPTPYRFVRIHSTLLGAFGIDAVTALAP